MLRIVYRNLRQYWRGDLAVMLGIAVGSAVLTGALFVGDSLRGSLAARAKRQSAGVTAAFTGVRLLDNRLAARLGSDIVPALILRGTAFTESHTVRVTIIGLDADGMKLLSLPHDNWDSGKGIAIASAGLMEKLNVTTDQAIRMSMQQPSIVPRSSLLGNRGLDDLTTTMTITVKAFTDSDAADFSLSPSAQAPLNLFVPLAFLQDRLDKLHRVNALLAFGSDASTLNARLADVLEPSDWGLKIAVPPSRRAYVTIESDQYLLSPQVVEAVETVAKKLSLHSERTLVYLANWIACDDKRRIPYSVVAALDPQASAPLGPFLPPNVKALRDDEIILADWPESPLKELPIGTKLSLIFFEPEIEAGAVEAHHELRLAGRIPLEGVARDPDLTPPFPGITDKLKIGEWNPPFPFDNTRIKPGDVNERYWETYRTTPKAYISTAAGEKLFGSRFGTVTSIRVAPAPNETVRETCEQFRSHLKQTLKPAALGIVFDDVRERLERASRGGNDFGGLFLGFSLFLIVSALLLVGLLMRLAVERRARDIGVMLALGFTIRRVRRLLMLEGLVLAVIGAILGIAVALIYSRLLIRILVELWPDSSARVLLTPHATLFSAVVGFLASVMMAIAAIGLSVYGLVKLPVPNLLRGRTDDPRSSSPTAQRKMLVFLATVFSLIVGLLLLYFGSRQSNPDFRAMSFFGGGAFLFGAGALAVSILLNNHGISITSRSSLLTLGFRNANRYVNRSLLTVLLLGAATYLIIAVECFRRAPQDDFTLLTGASGGFNLVAECDVPILQTWMNEPGRGDFLDSFEKQWQDAGRNRLDGSIMLEMSDTLDRMRVLAFRRRRGDDASCLNLFQATRPRLLGAPDALVARGGFRFSASEATTPEERANPWLLLTQPREDGVIPVIGEQNTIMWMMKKAVGDEIDLIDEAGRTRRGRIVATLQDSVFPSELLIGEAAFRELYPRDEGFAFFLIEADYLMERRIRTLLEVGYRPNGMIVTSARDIVAAQQAVIGTYLTTFQLLGGFGLLLGVLGLAVVIMRGVWDRLGEFALLKAVGYSTHQIQKVVFAEHFLLLLLGLGLGTVAAAISVAPHLAAGGNWPWRGILFLLVMVLITGIIAIVLAIRAVVRLPIMTALRCE